MLIVLKGIYDVVAVLLLFGAAVFIHEFGHYWMARRRGMKVEAFSIGFGPKIFGWTKNGIEYSWRWIPAGGFVKLPQMITSDALEGKADSGEVIPPAPPLSKILVAFAGPFMNVVLAFVIATIIYFVGLPVAVNPSYIGYVDTNSPEAKMGIHEGDRIIAVDGRKVDSWEDVQEASIFARSNVMPVVIERDGATNTYQLTAIVSDTLKLKVLNLDPRDHPVISEVKAGGAGEAGGLKAKDEIVSVGGVPVYGQERFVKLIEARAEQPTEIVLLRGDQRITNMVTPILNPATHKGLIGVGITANSSLKFRVQLPGPTPLANVRGVLDKTIGTFGALLHSKQTGVGPGDMSGPVGILTMLAAWVNTDYRLALNFLVLLNINLAMINLLPLPVLDGGHIVMSLIEWIRRRPVNVKIVEYTTTVFAALLISFMLYVTWADIKRISLFKVLFKSEMQVESPNKSTDTPAVAPGPTK